MVRAAVIVLIISGSALAITTAFSIAIRTRIEVTARRLGPYRAAASAALTQHLAGAVSDPPPRPRGRFQQTVMRELMLSVAANIRGEAADQLAALFRAYRLVEPARVDLNARRPLTRIRAAEALGAMGVQEAVPWLRDGLAHEDHELRFACARSLSVLGATSAVADVDAALSETASELSECIDVLLHFGRVAIPLLIGHLNAAPDRGARWLAAEALGELGALQAVPALRASVDAADDELAARAARALGRIGDRAATDTLARALTSQRPWFVRAAATRALGALEDPAAADLLVWALAADQWDVRDAAARALAAFGDAGVAAVTRHLDTLSDEAVAHFAGSCDMAGELDRLATRAATGNAGCDAVIRRAHLAGVTAALERLTSENGARGRYAAEVLSRAPGGAAGC